MVWDGAGGITPEIFFGKCSVKILHFGPSKSYFHYDFSLLQSHTTINGTTCHGLLEVRGTTLTSWLCRMVLEADESVQLCLK